MTTRRLIKKSIIPSYVYKGMFKLLKIKKCLNGALKRILLSNLINFFVFFRFLSSIDSTESEVQVCLPIYDPFCQPNDTIIDEIVYFFKESHEQFNNNNEFLEGNNGKNLKRLLRQNIYFFAIFIEKWNILMGNQIFVDCKNTYSNKLLKVKEKINEVLAAKNKEEMERKRCLYSKENIFKILIEDAIHHGNILINISKEIIKENAFSNSSNLTCETVEIRSADTLKILFKATFEKYEKCTKMNILIKGIFEEIEKKYTEEPQKDLSAENKKVLSMLKRKHEQIYVRAIVSLGSFLDIYDSNVDFFWDGIYKNNPENTNTHNLRKKLKFEADIPSSNANVQDNNEWLAFCEEKKHFIQLYRSCIENIHSSKELTEYILYEYKILSRAKIAKNERQDGLNKKLLKTEAQFIEFIQSKFLSFNLKFSENFQIFFTRNIDFEDFLFRTDKLFEVHGELASKFSELTDKVLKVLCFYNKNILFNSLNLNLPKDLTEKVI